VLGENLSPLVGWTQDDVRLGGSAGASARTINRLPRHSPCPDSGRKWEFSDLTVEGVFKLFIFYLDDGYVVAKHEVLIRLGELLAPNGILLDDLPSPGISSSQDSATTMQVLVDSLACSVPRHLHNLAHDSGVHLNKAELPSWWPTAPSADVLQKYEAAGVPFLRTEGVLALKVPIGSDTYVRTQLVNKVEDLRTRMQVMGYFQDTQVAVLILRVCMGVCRVNFLLRALPQPLVKMRLMFLRT
jgi:hypothetical protein